MRNVEGMAAELESSEVPLPPVVLEAAGDDTDAAKSPETKKRKLGVPQQPGAGAGGYGGSLADTGGIEVEQLEADEFKFLDGATHLAVLQSELSDVRNRLARQKNQGQYTPFKLFRPWSHRVMSVTDLTSGVWCEVQVEYRHLHRHLRNTAEWTEMEKKGSPVLLKTEGMKKGSDVHLKKELEVHEIVKVASVTKEDRTAVQLVSTYTQLAAIKAGGLEREFSVFGDPFDLGVLVRGVIDQLQYSPESGELVLLDNKTRRLKSMPSPQQKRGTSLQLMLYKYLLDRMCLGFAKPDLLYKHLHLDRDAVLTEGPLEFIQQCGLSSLFSNASSSPSPSKSPSGASTWLKFGAVADCILSLIANLGLPLVSSLMVQYEHQASGETLGVDTVEYDEQWMRAEVEKSLEFWAGEREAHGVDIEEAWKCNSCQFKDICVWRLKRELENSPAAKLPPSQ